jgi:hypothetical protein
MFPFENCLLVLHHAITGRAEQKLYWARIEPLHSQGLGVPAVRIDFRADARGGGCRQILGTTLTLASGQSERYAQIYDPGGQLLWDSRSVVPCDMQQFAQIQELLGNRSLPEGSNEADYWKALPLEPIRPLAELRELVFQHNSKRCPKWTFRLTDQTGVQLQPRLILTATRSGPQRLLEFKGLAHHVFRGSIEKGIFRKSWTELVRTRDPFWMRLTFVVWADEGEPTWRFQSTNAHTSRGWGNCFYLRDEVARLLALRLSCLDPTMLLSEHCLICNRALTDPVSRARCIGPECWGSSTIRIPWGIQGPPRQTTTPGKPGANVLAVPGGPPEELPAAVLVAPPRSL